MRKIYLLFLCYFFAMTAGHAQWALTGNSVSATDFLGTTNGEPLLFKIDDVNAGLLDYANYNTFLGYLSGNIGTVAGQGNAAFGYQALSATTSGHADVAVGFRALYVNTTGTFNVAVGNEALTSNTAGNGNIGVGSGALLTNSSGVSNNAVGENSLSSNSTGGGNNAFGLDALYNATGSNNVAVGDSALVSLTSGNENTAIGSEANVNAGTYSNSTMVGYGATATQSNEVIIGNASVTLIGGSVGWTTISDGRYKKNIKENVPGLTFINQLRPVTYNLDATGLNEFLRPSSNSQEQDAEALKAKEQISYTGFIAQDVETSAQKVGYDFSGVHIPQGTKDVYGLDYSKFVVPLVKAVQELSNTNDSLVSVIDSLRAADQSMQTQINSILQELKNMKGTTASLNQNAPNPFTTSTTIGYSIPEGTAKARLTITDANGTVLKSVELENRGPGRATISAGDLAPGLYFYTLVVNDNIVATKKMMLIR